MFVKKDGRKVREMFQDEEDPKTELYLARRKFEFPNGEIQQTICQPFHIEQVPNLQHLSLYDNNLTSLRGIGSYVDCSNLVDLDLGCNKLKVLPSELGLLTSLESLFCEDNQLEEFPRMVLKLTKLKQLKLSRNQLQDVADEIGKLEHLQLLNIDGNKIESLPSSIGQLLALRELYCRNNLLTAVPEEIGMLESLCVLALSSNQITQLSDRHLVNLRNLAKLYINGNAIGPSLPPGLGKLDKLAYMNVSSNKIEHLPPELAKWQPNEAGVLNPEAGVDIVFLGNPFVQVTATEDAP